MPAEELCNRLINEYGDSIFRICFLYLKDYYLAEDAAQETFISAVQAYNSFKSEASEKTWLTRIAINKCKNIMKTKWFRILRLDVSECYELTDERDFAQELMTKDSVSSAIMKLDNKSREVILLYYYQELSIKEIAFITNKNENAVLQQLHRARNKLKSFLKEDVDL